MDFSDEQREQIRRRSAFRADDDEPGWVRIISTVPRFPIRIAFPRAMAPAGYIPRFMPFDETYQTLEFPDTFLAARTDLRRSRPREEILSCSTLKGTDQDNYNYTRRRCGRAYRIGGLDGAPECIWYGNGVVRVYFESSGRELWNFEGFTGGVNLTDDVFAKILQKTVFLSEHFFTTLPSGPPETRAHAKWDGFPAPWWTISGSSP